MTYSDFYNYIISFYGRISSLLPFGFALPPIRATIEVSYGCNLHCRMCYQDQERRRNKRNKEMTVEEVKRIIDQMPFKTLITLTGGEILTKKYALELIKYAKRYHNCNIVTNGTMINQKIANDLVAAQPFLIGLSLDGIGKAHDDIRGLAGVFDKTIKGIGFIQKAKNRSIRKFPLVDVKTVILPENINELHELYRLCSELRVDFFTLSTLKGSKIQLSPPVLAAIPNASYQTLPKVSNHFDIKFLEKEFKKILKEKGKVKLRFYPGNLHLRSREYFSNKIKINDYFPCYFPWTSFNVSPYGDVFPCLSLNVGNIRKKNLWQIWNGKKMREFRQRLKKNQVYPACQGCCNLWFKNKSFNYG